MLQPSAQYGQTGGMISCLFLIKHDLIEKYDFSPPAHFTRETSFMLKKINNNFHRQLDVFLSRQQNYIRMGDC